MSLLGKRYFNIFIVFIVILVHSQNVTGSINYNDKRQDDQPFEVQPEHARTTREILEMFDNWAIDERNYTLQQATEHLLQFGALLRIQILDTFGALVYDHYDDYSIGQIEALYRVYQETLERKYNIFDIVPSVLAHSDMRPTKICRHIHKHVHTCLKESSMLCTTIRKNDHPHSRASLTPVMNITRRMYKSANIKGHFPEGFSLPAILERLKEGTLRLTVNLVSGLLHNVQYDSFDDDIRTAERNVMITLTSENQGADRHKVLMDKGTLRRVHTVSELLKELFERRKTMYDKEKNKSFAILSEHVIREIEAISSNIELLGTVYENNTIDMRYLLNLVLPRDVVDSDITEAKDYLLQKISDYDIVGKYLKVEKYQQSGPDQLLMEILGQMRDINFAVDLATALHVHARFWHQSHMISNLNELLELLDAYENLRNVPEYSSLMMLMDKIRDTLWDSKNVTVEISCNNPRACLRLGLEIVAKCVLINSETKYHIAELFLRLHKSGAIYTADDCQLPMKRTELTEKPPTTKNPTTTTKKVINDLITRKRLDTTEVSTVETTSVKSAETLMPTTDEKATKVVLRRKEITTEMRTVEPRKMTTETPTEFPTISTEDTTTVQTTTVASKFRKEPTAETTKQKTTDSTEKEQTTTPITIRKMVNLRKTTETRATEDQSRIEKLTITAYTTLKPPIEELRIQQSTTTEQMATKEARTAATGGSTAESITTDQPIILRANDDCGEKECTSEPSSESTDVLSSETWNRNRSLSPPLFSKNDDCDEKECTSEPSSERTDVLSSEVWNRDRSFSPSRSSKNRETTKLPNVTTTTNTSTTTEDSTANITSIGVNASSSSPERIMIPIGEIFGLLRKPETYSAIFTGEDCSREGCPLPYIPEETSISNDCSDTNCNISTQADCDEDSGCFSRSGNDKCDVDDPGCKFGTNERNIQHDCSDEGCPPTAVIPRDYTGCEGGECSTRSFECIGIECTEGPLISTTAPDCIDLDCPEFLESNESTCSGLECRDNNERRTSTSAQTTDPHVPTTSSPFVRCDNKDPHHQKKLNKLNKIRIMNALHATAAVPIAAITDNINDDDHSDESDLSEQISFKQNGKKHPELLHQGFPPWLQFPLDKHSKRQLPWHPLAQHSTVQAHKFRNEKFGQQSIGREVESAENRTNTRAHLNDNTNIDLGNSRRYLTGNMRKVNTPPPPNFSELSPANDDYRRVPTRLSGDADLAKWDQKSQLNDSTNIDLGNSRRYLTGDMRKVNTPPPPNFSELSPANDDYRRVPTRLSGDADLAKSDQKSQLKDNTNMDLGNLRRYLTGDMRKVNTPPPPIFSELSPANDDNRRVLTRLSGDADLAKWDQKSQLNDSTNIDLGNSRRYLTGNMRKVNTPPPPNFSELSPANDDYRRVPTRLSGDADLAKSDQKSQLKDNTNMDLGNLRRYLAGNMRKVNTPPPPIFPELSPANDDYRRVLSRLLGDADLAKWDQESSSNLKPDVQSNKNSDIPKRRMLTSMKTNPVLYQTKQSDDNIELVRKNRSIIRAPQRASRRYRAL